MLSVLAPNLEPMQCLQDAACILAVMMPCMRLYSFLGCQLAAAYPRTHSEWVRMYAAPAFSSLPRRQEQLLDRIGPSAPFGKIPYQ